MRFLSAGLVLLALTSASIAQLELNDAGASMTSAGVAPTSGAPFMVAQGQSVDFEVSGGTVEGYILLQGDFTDPGTNIAAISQVLNLNNVAIIGDGIGNTGVAPQLFVTGANGSSDWSFPVNAGQAGLAFGLQAIVADQALAPFFLNFSAAAEFSITGAFQTDLTSQLVGSADDGYANYAFAGGPYNFYGQAYTQISVSTNGWISFAGDVTGNDLSETIPELLMGTVGLPATANQPVVAMLWEDLDLGNNINGPQALTVTEDVATQMVTVTWQNVDYFPSDLVGTVSTIFDFANGTVVLDYSGYVAVTPPNEGIIGVSDGDLAQSLALPAGPDVAADIVDRTNGTVFGATLGFDYGSYYQDFFGGAGVGGELVDLAGAMVTFVDTSGLGNWVIL